MASPSPEQLKKKIIQFVNHTQVGCDRDLCFAHFCKKNPDNFKIQKPEALKLAMDMVKQDDLRYCENDGIIKPFQREDVERLSNEEEQIEKFVENYPRVIARIESLSSSFFMKDLGNEAENHEDNELKPEISYIDQLSGQIDLESIKKVNQFILKLPDNKKEEFMNNFNVYIQYEYERIVELIKYSVRKNSSEEEQKKYAEYQLKLRQKEKDQLKQNQTSSSDQPKEEAPQQPDLTQSNPINELQRLVDIIQGTNQGQGQNPLSALLNPAAQKEDKGPEFKISDFKGDKYKNRIKMVNRYMRILMEHRFFFECDIGNQVSNFFEYCCMLFEMMNLEGNSSDVFIELLKTQPKATLLEDVERLQNMLAIQLIQPSLNQLDYLETCCELLNLAYKSNLQVKRIDNEEFLNDTISHHLNMKSLTKSWYFNKKHKKNEFNFLNYPFLFSTVSKVDILQAESLITQNEQMTSQIHNLMMMGNASLYLFIKIRREHIIEDALKQINLNRKSLKKPMKVQFVGEQGVDEGGVRKEFFTLAVEQLFDPNYAMFILKQERLFWFNPMSFECSLNFELIGSILGLAIYNSDLLDVKFPKAVFKKLTGLQPGLEDIKEIEPEKYFLMKNILKMDKGFEDMDLTFTISYDNFGQEEIIEICENGKERQVNEHNKEEWVKLYLDWFFNKSIEKQFNSFKKGFMAVMDGLAFTFFNHDELEKLIIGQNELNMEELKKCTYYANGFKEDHQMIQWFWEIIFDMSKEEHKKFMQFCTGSDRAPLKGFKQLKFVIEKHGDEDQRLPSAHTCFNHLLLAEYSSKEVLKDKLMQAINNCTGFGLI